MLYEVITIGALFAQVVAVNPALDLDHQLAQVIQAVITSYSIHYTKLYEPVGR